MPDAARVPRQAERLRWLVTFARRLRDIITIKEIRIHDLEMELGRERKRREKAERQLDRLEKHTGVYLESWLD